MAKRKTKPINFFEAFKSLEEQWQAFTFLRAEAFSALEVLDAAAEKMGSSADRQLSMVAASRLRKALEKVAEVTDQD